MNAELEALVDKLPMPNRENEQSEFWESQIGWAKVDDPADRNLDLLPAHFRIDFGCPSCGAAWAELVAAGFTVQRIYTGTASWSGTQMAIALPCPRLDFRAVRMQCASGKHTYEFDSVTRRMRKYESWATRAGIGLGAVAIVGLAGMLLAGRRG
jgi:hypothetical protein